MAQPTTLSDLLRQAAAAGPDRVAVAVDGGPSLTYGSWDHRSDALAGGLQRAGVRPGDRVALLFDATRWTEYAVTYLAVHRSAAVAVPLGADLTGIELDRILGDCRPSAIVAPPDLAPRGTAVPVAHPGELEHPGLDRPTASAVHLSAPGEILYLSRSLSRPVPIARSHRALLAAPSLMFGPGAGAGSLLHAFPVGSVAGQDALCACLQPTPVGCLTLPAFDPDRFCALLSAGPGAACMLHPSTAQALLDSGATAGHDLSGLTRLILASGRVAPGLLLRLTAACPEAMLLAVDALGHPHGVRTVFTHERSRPASIGRPLGGTTVRISDEDGRPVRTGEVGRVWVRPVPAGDGRQATSRGDGGADVSTGDLGYVDDQGFLYLVMSRNEVVRSRRAAVLRAEVESALREHPTVVDAAVLGVPDDRSGGALAAAVVLGSPASAPQLQALVRDRLGDEKTPESVFFADELPRNPRGAVLRRALRRRLGLLVDRREPAQAATPVQETVVAAWRRVLGQADIGLHDDFFELGGYWFAVATVLSLLEDAFAVRVPVAAFLDSPTVAGLASAVETLRSPGDRAPAAAAVAFSQEGMLWHERFAPGCQNLPGLARRYRGPLDVAALGRALDEIVRRHGALRTTFELRDGRPVQVVHPHRSLQLPVRDLSGLAASEGEAQVQRLVTEAGQRPFDLVVDALFEPTLLRLADDDHVLVIRTHHSVFDDWSVGVFRRELSALYSAYADGGASPLPELPLQFSDFSRRQRRALAGPAGVRELTFWRRELAGAPFTAQLPVDDPDLAEGSPQATGEPVSLTLPPELHDGLRALARRERATVFMTMLAAFGVLVQRYSGQDDVVLASVVANRNRTELEGLIGCFTKKVPLRLRLSGDPSFVEVLARTRAALLGALSHQDLPFEAVLQDVLAAPAAAHGLAPHVVLMFQGVTPRQELALPGVESAGFETSASATRAHFMAGTEERPTSDVPQQPSAPHGDVRGDLHPPAPSGDVRGDLHPPAPPWGAGLYLGTFVILSVEETDRELSCVARGAFHGPAVRQLLDSFRTLLADVAADPARRVSQLSLLDDAARAEVLSLGSGPAQPLPADTAHGAFAVQVRRTPDAVAVRARAGQLTFAELDTRADRLAGRLRALGVGSGDRVGVALQPSPDLVVSVLAVWKAGAAWVGLDPDDGDDRLGRIVAEASLDVVVADQARGGLARHARVVAANAGDGRGAATVPEPAAAGAADAAVVFYGAGPSAVDRRVVLDHRSVLNLLTGLRHDVHRWPEGTAPLRRVCLSSAPTQDGFLRQLVALLDGHGLYVPDRPLQADPREAVSLLRAGELDLLDCTPEDLEALLDAGLGEVPADRGQGRVEPVVVVGTRAEVCPVRWRTLRGLIGVRGHVLYGPPECAFGATARTTAGASARAGAGRPMANVSSHVLDPRGQPVPTRAVGELHLGGPSLARGYLGKPHPRPPRQPFVEGALEGASGRLLRTGQLARRLPDGGVELLGPVGADADLRGFRVDPARIQAALAGCPGVRDVAVALQRDERGEPRLVAQVVPDGQPPTLAGLRACLWARLPGYACPSAMAVVPRLPAQGHAEVVAAEFPSEPSPADQPSAASAEASVLTALWAEVVGVVQVAPGENYWQAFSFLEVLDRARDAGVPVAGKHVTRNRTVEALAADLAAGRRRSQA